MRNQALLRDWQGFYAFGATPDPWTAPVSSLAQMKPSELPAPRLYAEALRATQQPGVQNQLSWFGSLANFTTIAATQVAAEKVGAGANAIGALTTLAPSVIKAITDALPNVMDNADSLFSQASGAVPIVGQIIQVLTTGFSLVGARQDAANQQSQRACQALYQGMGPPSRGNLYGGPVPCDYFRNGVYSTSLYLLFAALESDEPEKLAKSCVGAPAAAKKLVEQQLNVECGPYIPAADRAIMQILRLAIRAACNDPNSDGGLSLWPVYLDFVYSQMRQGRLTGKWVDRLYACKVAGPYYAYEGMSAAPTTYPCGCARYETRALQEFWGLINEWKLTIEPYYSRDKAQAEDIRKQIEGILATLRNKPLAKIITTKPRIQIKAASLKGKTSALTAATSNLLYFALGGAVAAGGVYLYARHRRP